MRRSAPGGRSSGGSVQREKATKHTYDCEKDRWFTEETQVGITPGSFAQGGMRKCYHCVEFLDARYTSLTPPLCLPSTNHVEFLDASGRSDDRCENVAKFCMTHRGNDAKDVCFGDAKMQMVAEYYAQQFNKSKTAGPSSSSSSSASRARGRQQQQPQEDAKISFVVSQVLELPQRPDNRWATMEPKLSGSYEKHNNNAGAVFDSNPVPQVRAIPSVRLFGSNV